ncbi:DUF4864 domain-containing protein [Nostoc sp. UHCC 0870]|jgi:hypothetical protein|uniref:DUF4864 domain-containing protein n=1 Tax=Nostoc sp. UHCC 0870 TaxID=2914041 RepID=UPI001EDCB936|nr:DUF4864 domain-containing protein [Nostoc sp. UHCC 0870]UKO96416.1 DUF4864 domain-containing protein [Nostoc sp. UHCC 0870]
MEATDKDFIAIRAVIESQLEAFQKDDAQAAFALASPGIKEQFQTPDHFMQMVSLSYPAVYRPRSVFFEKITTIQDNITQPVLLLAPDGMPLRALYFMEKQRDDTWKINGCILVSVEAESI